MMRIQRTDEMIIYLGKSVSRKAFRVFVYAKDGRQRIAESYEEFDLLTHNQEWFATKEEAIAPKKEVIEEPKEFVKLRKKTGG
jgi:hypothetical protein